MAKKRLTDVEKWKKPFFRKLPCEYKLFWIYLLDDCDHCGIWHVDIEVAEIKLGIKLSLEKARGLFAGRVVEFDNGDKWFLPDFIGFQYGQVTEKNKMYNAIAPTLKKYSIDTPSIGYKIEDISSLSTSISKSNSKSNEGGVGETYTIEHCREVAMNDDRWVKANKTNYDELEMFNDYLERLGKYSMVPIDYKQYFAKLKGRWPEVVRPQAKDLTMEELKQIAANIDKQNK